MNSLKQFITKGLVAAMLVLGIVAVSPAVSFAGSPGSEVGKGVTAAGSDNDKTCGAGGNQKCTLGDRITLVINILLFVISAVAVIMIILGGIRYVTSNGDSSQITGAKNTILYAVIGIVVALLAYAIVNFVVTQFT